MQQNRCIPCEANKKLQQEKIGFLFDKALQRAKLEKQDYVIYNDTEDNKYRILTFKEAYARGEEIILHVSRFEKPYAI